MAASLSVTIRPVHSADAAAWENLRDALWSDERARHAQDITSFFAGTLGEPNAVLLAETTDGAIVGMVELSLRSDIPDLLGQKTGYIEGLYVLPSHRFQRIAARLLHSSKDWARQQGCSAFASDRDERIIVDHSFSNTLPTGPS